MTTSARTILTGRVVVVPDGRVGMVMDRSPRRTTCYVAFVQNGPLLGVDAERLRLASSNEMLPLVKATKGAVVPRDPGDLQKCW